MEETKNRRKIKILYLLDTLQQKTDENKGLTIPEIFDELYLKGISAERKAIYSDISALKEAGFEIQKRKTQENVTYHLLGDSLNGNDIRKLAYLVGCTDFAATTEQNNLSLKLAKKTTEENRARILGAMLNFYPLSEWNIQEELTLAFDSIFEKKKVTFTYRGNTIRLSPFAIAAADRSLYLVGGSRTLKDGIDFFDFSYITDMIQLDRKAETAAVTTGSDSFDLKQYLDQNIASPIGRTVELELSVPENQLTAVLDDLAKGDAVKDSAIEKTEDGSFQVKILLKLTPETIKYLYKNSETVILHSPRCVKEKLKRIEKLANAF